MALHNFRVLCIWLPNWPIQRWIGDRPEHSSAAILLYRQDPRRGQLIHACSTAARQAGVRVGMNLSEAQTLVAAKFQAAATTMDAMAAARVTSDPMICELHDPHPDEQQLLRIAHACDCFSPVVGLDHDPQGSTAGPAGLLLDVTGLARLFGNEQRLAELVVETFRRWGYLARVAIADTVGLAWGATRFGQLTWRHIEEPCEAVVSETEATPETSSSSDESSSDEVSSDEVSSSETTGENEWLQPGKLQEHVVGVSQTHLDGAEDSFQYPPLPWRDDLTVRVQVKGRFEPWVLPGNAGEIASRWPVAALRLSSATLETLTHLGLQSIGQLQQLPRDALAARLGTNLLVRLDQLIGQRAEPIQAIAQPVQFRAAVAIEYPTVDWETIQELMRQLVEEVCAQMRGEHQGALRLEVRLRCEDGSQATLRVGLFEATAGARHVMDLLRMQGERLELREPVHTIQVDVPLAARVEHAQYELFDGGAHARRRELALLLNRLSCRLGREQVLQVRLQPGAQPEHAFRYVPMTGRQPPPPRPPSRRQQRQRRIRLRGDGVQFPSGTRPADPVEDGNPEWIGKTSSQRTESVSYYEQVTAPALAHETPQDARALAGREGHPLDRPIEILPTPDPLEMISLADEGPPAQFTWNGRQHRVVQHWGPERIETGWWRGPATRRDYYRVATQAGYRFWIFRELRQGHWFLHGVYG